MFFYGGHIFQKKPFIVPHLTATILLIGK